VSTWSIEHVGFLIAHRMCERIDLEFKREVPEPVEVARWLGGMANAGSGVIVFGIDEDAQSRAIRRSDPPVPLAEGEARVREAARHIDEPVPVSCTPLHQPGAADGLGYLVVEVGESRRLPHFVDGVAWLRVDHGLRKLRRAEIGRLFARSDRFLHESGLAEALRRPARIVADIQRLGADRVLMFKNIGDLPAYGVRWRPLACRGAVSTPSDDPFPVDEMAPLAMHAVRASFPASELPAKIEVTWRDERNAPREALVVVT
jgi:hypothetical protein